MRNIQVLLVFAVAVLLPSALPLEKENGLHRSVPGANERKFLHKRKPPGKVPGPQMLLEDARAAPLSDGDPSPTALPKGPEEEAKKKEEEKMVAGADKGEGKDGEREDKDAERKATKRGRREAARGGGGN